MRKHAAISIALFAAAEPAIAQEVPQVDLPQDSVGPDRIDVIQSLEFRFPNLEVSDHQSQLRAERAAERLRQLLIQQHVGPGYGVDGTRSIPSGVQGPSETLENRAEFRHARCGERRTPGCQYADGLELLSFGLSAAAERNPDCDGAAAAFRVTYATALPDKDTAKRFDLACLGSFVQRVGDRNFGSPLEIPELLLPEGAANDVLDVVGLLFVGDSIICAGLILPNRTFVTARHCVKEGAIAGIYKVVSASGRLEEGSPRLVGNGDWSDPGVRADWAIMAFPDGPPRDLPDTHFVTLTAPREVTLVAAYPHESATEYARVETMPLRALRFPRNDTCQAIIAFSGCLQLTCQTVRGFSGAPVFAGRRADGSFEVVGLVSGSEGTDAGCRGGEPLENSTFAVSSSAIGQNK